MRTYLRLAVLAALLPSIPTLALAQTITLTQDAATIGRGRAEITPTFGTAVFTESGESQRLFNAFTGQVRFGLADRVDLVGSYSRLQAPGGGGTNQVAFGPKVGLMANRLAVAVPITMLVGRDVKVSDTIVVEPTVIGTVPLGNRVDFNPSFGVLLPTCEGCATGFRTGIGFGIKAGDQVTLRPDVGIVKERGSDGMVWTLGLGVSIHDRR